MKKLLPILLCFLFGCNYQIGLENNELLPPEAFFAINNWSAQRAYPYGYVNDKKFFNEFIDVKNKGRKYVISCNSHSQLPDMPRT